MGSETANHDDDSDLTWDVDGACRKHRRNVQVDVAKIVLWNSPLDGVSTSVSHAFKQVPPPYVRDGIWPVELGLAGSIQALHRNVLVALPFAMLCGVRESHLDRTSLMDSHRILFDPFHRLRSFFDFTSGSHPIFRGLQRYDVGPRIYWIAPELAQLGKGVNDLVPLQVSFQNISGKQYVKKPR
jgi:hypothetical protein